MSVCLADASILWPGPVSPLLCPKTDISQLQHVCNMMGLLTELGCTSPSACS